MGAHPNPSRSGRSRRFLRWLTLAGKIAGILVLFLLIAGAIYQWAATTREARLYPPPGRLIDVGGHRLHMYCAGQGTPTVVFDAGLGDSSVTWELVQPDVAKFTRACAYDIPVAPQVARSAVPGEGFPELPRHLFRRRVFADGKVNETTAIMRQNHEDESHLEKGRWGDEKVCRDKIFHVVL